MMPSHMRILKSTFAVSVHDTPIATLGNELVERDMGLNLQFEFEMTRKLKNKCTATRRTKCLMKLNIFSIFNLKKKKNVLRCCRKLRASRDCSPRAPQTAAA